MWKCVAMLHAVCIVLLGCVCYHYVVAVMRLDVMRVECT